MKEKRGPGRPPSPVSRSFTVGDFEVTVTGPKEGLKFESRHDYLQFAVGDGELRERGGPAVTSTPSPTVSLDALGDLIDRLAPRSSIPSEGPGTTHVLSDIGLRGPTNPQEDAARHLSAVTASVGGF